MNTEEIFKDVDGYEGLYQVSNLGRLKNINYRGTGVHRFFTPTKKDGYLRSGLRKNNIAKNHYIHQLVAIAFLNHVPNKHFKVVDHIDGDKLNNNVNNLQSISQRENITRRLLGVSKYAGVYPRNYGNKWSSSININGKKKHLGTFKKEFDAHLSYQKELNKLKN